MSPVDANLEAILAAQSAQSKAMMEYLQQSTTESMEQQKKSMLLQFGMREVSKQAKDLFTLWGDGLLASQGKKHAILERGLGAREEALESVHGWTPASQVLANAPKVDRNNVGSVQKARNDAEFWNRILSQLGTGTNALSHTITVNGVIYDTKAELADIGVTDIDNLSQKDINDIRAHAEDVIVKGNAIENLLRDELTPERLAAFYDELGEVSVNFRADTERFVEAHEKLGGDIEAAKEILQNAKQWKADHAAWIAQYDTNHDGIVDTNENPGMSDPEPDLEDYLSLGDKIMLGILEGLGFTNIDNGSCNDIINNLEAAITEYDDALENMRDNRHTSPVTGEKNDPTNGNQFAEIMLPALEGLIGGENAQADFLQGVLDKVNNGEELSQHEKNILSGLGINVNNMNEVGTTCENLLNELQGGAGTASAAMSGLMNSASLDLNSDFNEDELEETLSDL